MDIIKIISENSLTVRCLPHVVISRWSYREGDEERILKPSYDGNGKLITGVKKHVEYNEKWKRKFVVEERTVERGGWWYVKETRNTDSTVIFSREYDKFFAPTLEEALQLYLDSKKSTE